MAIFPSMAAFCARQALRAYARVLATIHRVDLRQVFDAKFYRERYSDVARAGVDPLGHFLRDGGREHRQPHPLFDTEYYLASNPDVAASGINPLVHYLQYGWKEYRRPNVLFDAEWYRAHHPELPEGSNPFVDFLRHRAAGEMVAGGPPTADLLREQGAHSGGEGLDGGVDPERVVDIVVPVYGGLEHTRACLESIRAARCRTRFQTIAINDASPDNDLVQYVRQAAEAYGVTLVENERNLGFAGSVNRALALHSDRDAVLLNSDAIVANDWLDRLVAAAYSESRTGTATPFSNNATLCSYPRPGEDNTLPDGATLGELDSVFRQANAGRRVSLPTAVGFCMYLRRDCLVETGGFDEAAFPLGYGEENDFCQRASAGGWRHVLAADVFVYHAGATSFGALAAALREQATAELRRRYPGWDQLLAKHGRNDPAALCRFRASARRLRDSGRPVILAIQHALGGGAVQYLKELERHLQGRVEFIALRPSPGSAVMLEALNPNYAFRIAVDPAADYAGLLEAVRLCGVQRVHIQHTYGYAPGLPERLVSDLAVPFDFSAHDYYAICPQVTLTDATGQYCGEPDEAGCRRCLAIRPHWPPRDIVTWRRENGWLVKKAERVIAPSEDTARRLRKYFPSAEISAAAHPEAGLQGQVSAPRLGPDEVLRVGVIGALGPHKGFNRLRACAGEARRRGLPLEFVLIGYVDPHPASASLPFRQTGHYRQEQLPAMLAKTDPHLVWFPAQGPETYSFTLSATLEAGLPVAIPDLGAMAERVGGRAWTWVVPWQWGTARLLEFFVAMREDVIRGCAPAAPDRAPAARADFYKSEYLRPLTPLPR